MNDTQLIPTVQNRVMDNKSHIFRPSPFLWTLRGFPIWSSCANNSTLIPPRILLHASSTVSQLAVLEFWEKFRILVPPAYDVWYNSDLQSVVFEIEQEAQTILYFQSKLDLNHVSVRQVGGLSGLFILPGVLIDCWTYSYSSSCHFWVFVYSGVFVSVVKGQCWGLFVSVSEVKIYTHRPK